MASETEKDKWGKKGNNCIGNWKETEKYVNQIKQVEDSFKKVTALSRDESRGSAVCFAEKIVFKYQ